MEKNCKIERRKQVKSGRQRPSGYSKQSVWGGSPTAGQCQRQAVPVDPDSVFWIPPWPVKVLLGGGSSCYGRKIRF